MNPYIKLVKPVGHENSVPVVSVSGGKDSTATVLLMLENNIKCNFVFADTEWESPITYEYLDYLEQTLTIKINRVGVAGGMQRKIRERAGFPARKQRWCTKELKVIPIKEYHEAISLLLEVDTISVVGIRSQESKERAELPEFEYCNLWNGYVWRPIKGLSVEDVLKIHNRHNVKVNPLYKLGFSRVGCFPCIYSQKEEIRLLALLFPDRIGEIDSLEKEITEQRAQLNKETPGRFACSQATFFQSKMQNHDGSYTPMYIKEIVSWAKTERGGRQLPLVQPQASGGCFRWGLCDRGGDD